MSPVSSLAQASPNPPQFNYMRFERARIIGARALQVAMGAPIVLEKAHNLLDPVRVAELEFNENLIPITVHRPNVQATRPNAILPQKEAPAKRAKKSAE